jgi:DNA repair exonuclease SbcCD ATPase subunit
LNSIMQLTSTLLKNDSLMNSVAGLSKMKQNSTLPVSEVSEKQENTELSSLSQKLENIANDISDKNVDKGTIKNLTNNLVKNENSIDLNSIMQLTSTLLKNDSLMNSVAGLSKMKQNPTLPVSKVSEKKENTKWPSLSQKLETIANDISELKQENVELSSLSQTLENIANDISELKQETEELSSLSQRLGTIANDISELKKELHDVREQNSFSKFFTRIFNNSNK